MRFEELNPEEQQKWREFAKSRAGELLSLANNIFNVHQSYGFPLEAYEIKAGERGYDDKEIKIIGKYIQLLQEKHQEISRKSARKKFNAES